MKLLIQTPEGTIVNLIKEYELGKTIQCIKTNYLGTEVNPLKYELFRYKLPKGVVVIFKDNRVLRTRNEWFEYRALAALAREYGAFKHGVLLKKNGYQTEVDGVSLEENLLVEIKRDFINQGWIDFYSSKLKKLGYKILFLVAPAFKKDLIVPSDIKLIKFRPDWRSIHSYYQHYKFPTWIREKIAPRHFRFLLPNGRWKGAKRKFSKTAKHTPESKFYQAIKWLKFWTPVKIYYTMSRMVNPPREYFGRGYPLPHLLAVFDIDADSHTHIIGPQGFCQRCITEASEKRKFAEEILTNEGYQFKTIFSGKKGFHIYIFEEDEAKEVNPGEFFQIMEKIKAFTDSISFRDKNNQFDIHRIIKVPNTIDASTGMIVNTGIKKLNLNDQLIFL